MKDGKSGKVPTVFLGVRIKPEAKNRLGKVAQAERRSVSKQIEHIIMNYTINQ